MALTISTALIQDPSPMCSSPTSVMEVTVDVMDLETEAAESLVDGVQTACRKDASFIQEFAPPFILPEEYHAVEISEYFCLTEVLGKGVSGTVYRCIENFSGTDFACKVIPKMKDSGVSVCKASVLSEVLLMAFVSEQSPYIIGLEGILEDSENVYILTELCEAGDMFSSLESRSTFTEMECAIICERMASALASLHRNGIMHRDVKLENIFVCSNEDITDVRMGDFGCATRFRTGQKLQKLTGTPQYMAPSVLTNCYGPEADLWSLGVVLYMMLSGEAPFSGSTIADILSSIMNHPWIKQHSKDSQVIASNT